MRNIGLRTAAAPVAMAPIPPVCSACAHPGGLASSGRLGRAGAVRTAPNLLHHLGGDGWAHVPLTAVGGDDSEPSSPIRVPGEQAVAALGEVPLAPATDGLALRAPAERTPLRWIV